MGKSAVKRKTVAGKWKKEGKSAVKRKTVAGKWKKVPVK
jgi:hypothetical protein